MGAFRLSRRSAALEPSKEKGLLAYDLDALDEAAMRTFRSGFSPLEPRC